MNKHEIKIDDELSVALPEDIATILERSIKMDHIIGKDISDLRIIPYQKSDNGMINKLNLKYKLIIEEKDDINVVGNKLSEPIVVSSEDTYECTSDTDIKSRSETSEPISDKPDDGLTGIELIVNRIKRFNRINQTHNPNAIPVSFDKMSLYNYRRTIRGESKPFEYQRLDVYLRSLELQDIVKHAKETPESFDRDSLIYLKMSIIDNNILREKFDLEDFY